MLYDLREWEAAGLTAESEWWMRQHAAAASGLWNLGSQPILHLLLHGRWAALPGQWNRDGLGRVRRRPLSIRRSARWTWFGS